MNQINQAVAYCMMNPGKQAYIISRDYRSAVNNIMEAKRLYPDYPVSRLNDRMTLPNGSRVNFRHCASKKEYPQFMGTDMHYQAFDEHNPPDEESIELLKRRKYPRE